MTSLIQNIIQEKRRRIFEGKDLCAVSRDLIDVLMSNGSDELSLTDELISDNMIDFMIPAEDSVPVLITLAIKYLSECPLALQQLEVRYIYALKWFLLLIVTKFGCLRREVPGMGSGFEIPVQNFKNFLVGSASGKKKVSNLFEFSKRLLKFSENLFTFNFLVQKFLSWSPSWIFFVLWNANININNHVDIIVNRSLAWSWLEPSSACMISIVVLFVNLTSCDMISMSRRPNWLFVA